MTVWCVSKFQTQRPVGRCGGRNKRLYTISFLCCRCQQFVILIIFVTFIINVLLLFRLGFSIFSSVCFCMFHQKPKCPTPLMLQASQTTNLSIRHVRVRIIKGERNSKGTIFQGITGSCLNFLRSIMTTWRTLKHDAW